MAGCAYQYQTARKKFFIKKIREWFSDTTGIVIELKYAENGDMDAACSEALIKTGGSVII